MYIIYNINFYKYIIYNIKIKNSFIKISTGKEGVCGKSGDFVSSFTPLSYSLKSIWIYRKVYILFLSHF